MANIPEHSPTRSNRWLTRGVLAIGVTSLLSDVSHEMATTILPAFQATQMAGSPIALGLIEGVADGLAGYFKLIGGWTTDRMGRRKPVVVGGYVLTALATASFGFAGHWVTILGSRALAWIARGFRSPGRNALLADSVDGASYGRAFGFERAMDSAGAVIGPLCAIGLVAWGFTYRSVFLMSALPGLLAVGAIMLFVRERSRPARADSRLLGDLRALPRGYRPFLLVVGIFGLGQFAPTLLVLRATELLAPLHGPSRGAGYAMGLYVLFNAAQALTSYTIGALARRFGSVQLLGAGYASFAAAAVGFGLTGAHWSSLLGLFMLAGVAVGTIEAMEPTAAAERLPEHLRGTGFGALGAANSIGDLLSSLMVGGLWTWFGPAGAFLAAAVCNLASVGLLFGWMIRRSPRIEGITQT